MERRVRSGLSSEHAWNETSIELAQAAESHCRAFIVLRYVETLRNLEKSLSKKLHDCLLRLCELYAFYWVLQRLGDFLQVRKYEYLSNTC